MYGIAPFDKEFGRLLELFLWECIVQNLFKSAYELDRNENFNNVLCRIPISNCFP